MIYSARCAITHTRATMSNTMSCRDTPEMERVERHVRDLTGCKEMYYKKDGVDAEGRIKYYLGVSQVVTPEINTEVTEYANRLFRLTPFICLGLLERHPQRNAEEVI
jgi:hypothetical protein